MEKINVSRGTMSIIYAGQTFGNDVLCNQRTSPGGFIMDFKRSSEIVLLPVDNIVSNVKQARKHYEQRKLESLCESISENGLIQPITVRPIKFRKYEIISGERRLRACIMAGITHIPSIIIESTDERAAVLSLTENIQSQMLNCFEEADAIKNLINKILMIALYFKSFYYSIYFINKLKYI